MSGHRGQAPPTPSKGSLPSQEQPHSPLSPRSLPPLASVTASSSSSFVLGGRTQSQSQSQPHSHTHRHAAAAGTTSAVDDDVLHWERSLHSEVVGSPRILLDTPTRRRPSSDTAVSFHNRPEALTPPLEAGSFCRPAGRTGAGDGASGAQLLLQLPPPQLSPLSPTPPRSSGSIPRYGATDTRPSPLLSAGERPGGGSQLGTPQEFRHDVPPSTTFLGPDALDGEGPRDAAAHERHMRKRLLNEDFFTGPIRKWRRDGRFPFKLLNNILIFLCLLVQLSLFQLPETVANEQQRQAIVHHFTGSDTYLSRAKGNLVSRPTLFLDEQIQVFQAIESFVDVYYNLTNTSVSELNYYYWQRDATDRDKLLGAYHALAVEAGQSWVNGEEVLQLLQEYQRRKRVKAYVRANQVPNRTTALPGPDGSNASFAQLNLSMVQPVVMQVLAYPFSLRERLSPSQASPRWFTFLLDAKNPLGPFRHYNRSHTLHRQQQQQPRDEWAQEARGGHKQFQFDPRVSWDTNVLTDADLQARNATIWRRPDDATTTGAGTRARRKQKRQQAPDSDFLKLVCHARIDVLSGRFYSPCRTPVLSGAAPPGATTPGAATTNGAAEAASPLLAFQGRKGNRALKRSAAAAQPVVSDLLFSFMDNVVAVRLFASVRHLSIPSLSSSPEFLFRSPLGDDQVDDAHNANTSRAGRYTRHQSNRPAIPFDRSVYRWMMEKNLRVHRGGLVEAQLAVRTSVVRLQPRYTHPAFLNALLLACLAVWELHLRGRALGRIHRYRRRVALEKRRLHRRTVAASRAAAAHRGSANPQSSDACGDVQKAPLPPWPASLRYGASVGAEAQAATQRVRLGMDPHLSASSGSSSSSSDNIDRLLDSASDDDVDDADLFPEAEGLMGTGWGPWLRSVWWQLRLGIYEELGLSWARTGDDSGSGHDGVGSAAGGPESQPLLPSSSGLQRRESSDASSHSSPRRATSSSSGTVRAFVMRRREEARQERLLARRYVSLQDSWRYQLQQSMGVGWHHVAVLSACLTLLYAVLYLAQLLPLATSFRTDTVRSLALGLACLSSSVVFLSYARYFPRVYFPILITKVVIPRLLIFVLSIAPLFLGYALFFHIVFGSHSDGRFSTLGWSAMSLYFMAYGDSLIPAINTSERGASRAVVVLANVMTVLFVLLFMMTILNFALGITIHEWHRIRQRFGTVLNMSSILFSVRTREEVKAEALDKVRASLELLLYMKYEDEVSEAAAAAAAAAAEAEAEAEAEVEADAAAPNNDDDDNDHDDGAGDASVPPPPPPPAADIEERTRYHQRRGREGHRGDAGTARTVHGDSGDDVREDDLTPETTQAPTSVPSRHDLALHLLTSSSDAPATLQPSAVVPPPDSASDDPESVQLSAATTIGNMPGDDFGASETADSSHTQTSAPADARHRDAPLSMSSLSDEL